MNFIISTHKLIEDGEHQINVQCYKVEDHSVSD